MPVRKKHSADTNEREQQSVAAWPAKRPSAPTPRLLLVKSDELQDSHKRAQPSIGGVYPGFDEYVRAELLRRASSVAAVTAAAITAVLLGLVVIGNVI